MHIKRIHEMVEKLTKCAEMEFEKGAENIDTKEMGEVLDMVKDLCEAEYYAKISKAMDESEYGEDYDYMGAYDEHERKGYRGQRRDSRGRYMSRRSYTEPMMMYDDMREKDYMDGRMYYGGSSGSGSSSSGSGMSGGSSGGSSSGGSRGYSEGGQMSSRMQRDGREGRSGESRRGYMESKEKGKDKSEKMKELETYMKDLSEDVTEMIGGMSPEEKALMKNKMQTLMTKIQ